MTALSTIDTLRGHDDLYGFYERLRARGAVHADDSIEAWVATGHREVLEVLRDPRWSPDNRHSSDHADWVAHRSRAGVPDMSGRTMLFMDPPDHTRVRGLVSKAFTPRSVEALRPWLETLVEELLDGLGDGDDFMEAVAYALPIAVICQLLGVPEADRGLFRQETARFAGFLEYRAPDDVLREAAKGMAALGGYLMELCERRRAEPRDDLVTRLVQAEEAGDRLRPDELLSTCVILLVAGHETTMNLLGNGLYALSRHPDQWALLREDPGLIPGAVEELLRYDSPVQLTLRTATEDLPLAGQVVPKGRQILLLLGAANRDPERFDAPAVLDVRRPDARQHISFGHGGHFCLGAPLARLEGQVAFAAMARRWPTLELAEAPEYRPTLTLRGLRSLYLRT